MHIHKENHLHYRVLHFSANIKNFSIVLLLFGVINWHFKTWHQTYCHYSYYIAINYKYIQLHSKFNYLLFFFFLVKVPQQQQRLAKVKSQVKKNKPAQYNMHIHKRNYKCPCNRCWQLKEIYLVQGGSKDLSSFNDISKSSNIEN